MYTLYATAVPPGIRTGDFRSGPPPVGKMVVLTAVRVFTGREGYRRRAVSVNNNVQSGLTTPDLLSLMTFWRYGIFRKSVLSMEFPLRLSRDTSARNFCMACGCRTRRKLDILNQHALQVLRWCAYKAQERRQAVVSLPAASMLTICPLNEARSGQSLATELRKLLLEESGLRFRSMIWSAKLWTLSQD